MGQGEAVGRALGEGSAEAEGGLEFKGLPDAEGVASAVHTVAVELALVKDVLEELATEDGALCAVLLTHALGVAQLEEEGLAEAQGEGAALALAGGLRVALAQNVAGADGLALAEGDWDATALAVRAGEGVGCGDEVAVADAEGAGEARGVALSEALLWPVTEGVAGELPVPCQLNDGSRVANADGVPRGADGLGEPLPLPLPAAVADAEGCTVSEAAPEEAGLPEGPRLALAAPEDDVRPLVVGEGSAVHTVAVGLALARGALGVPDEDTVLLGVCEGVPNGVRMPLGVGVRDSVLLSVPIGEPVCVIFGVPVPLGVALSVGHRLTRPPPPAGAL